MLLFSITIVICLMLLSACGSVKETEFITVRLQQEWIPNSNYAGAILAKHEFAANQDMKLNIEILPGSDAIDSALQVQIGNADFGDASADHVLLAISKGAPLVVIGTVSQYSPTCFLTLQGSGIYTPRDFEGKKIGVLTGTNTEKIYRLLLKKSGLPTQLPGEVEAPFELTSFIAGQYDVRPAFIYDEPVTLKQEGISFNIINPVDYGVKFVGTVYFCKRDLVLNNPEKVQSFIDSVADGWRAATRRPEYAMKLLKDQFPEVDETREVQSLKVGMDSFTRSDDKLLYSVVDDWAQMVSDLVSMGGEDNENLSKINLSNVINNSFLDKYYVKVSNK